MDNWTDIVNALFEFGAVFALWLHIKRLMKDKAVSGVSILATAFFSAWGYWNIFFYPHNGLLLSGIAGAAVALLNTIYVVLLIKYSKTAMEELDYPACRGKYD
jgi:hypothetical protein